MYCRSCGSYVGAGRSACPSCGARFEPIELTEQADPAPESAQGEPAGTPDAAQPRRSWWAALRRRPRLVACAAIAVVLAVAGGAWSLTRGDGGSGTGNSSYAVVSPMAKAPTFAWQRTVDQLADPAQTCSATVA